MTDFWIAPCQGWITNMTPARHNATHNIFLQLNFSFMEPNITRNPYRTITGISCTATLGACCLTTIQTTQMMTIAAHLKAWSSRSGILLCSFWMLLSDTTWENMYMKAAMIPFRLSGQGLWCFSFSCWSNSWFAVLPNGSSPLVSFDTPIDSAFKQTQQNKKNPWCPVQLLHDEKLILFELHRFGLFMMANTWRLCFC